MLKRCYVEYIPVVGAVRVKDMALHAFNNPGLQVVASGLLKPPPKRLYDRIVDTFERHGSRVLVKVDIRGTHSPILAK
jgi:hypothetical protein